MKRSLILGIGGQDGSYLAEELLSRGHEVHGLHRRSSVDNLWRIAGVRDMIKLHVGDITDPLCIRDLVTELRPNRVYNMADQDHVGSSFGAVMYQIDVTAKAVASLLETAAVIQRAGTGHCRVFQPLSATMLDPQSPYALAKRMAAEACAYYRKRGVWVATGIMYNHDSPRRGSDYLLHKIARGVIAAADERRKFTLGDLESRIDCGHAGEYMQAVADLMEMPEPDDWPIGTGKPYPIRELVAAGMGRLGMNDLPENWVVVDPAFKRLGSADLICDATKVRDGFGWRAEFDARSMANLLVDHYKGLATGGKR